MGTLSMAVVNILFSYFFSCGILVVGLAYPVFLLSAPLLERYSHKCIPQHKWNPVQKLKPLLDAYGGPYKDKYRFWTGATLMLRLTVTVTFSFTLRALYAYIITVIIMGILTFWFFANGVYSQIYLSTLEAFYLLNIFLLSIVSLATVNLWSSDLQIATIVSVSHKPLMKMILKVYSSYLYPDLLTLETLQCTQIDLQTLVFS